MQKEDLNSNKLETQYHHQFYVATEMQRKENNVRIENKTMFILTSEGHIWFREFEKKCKEKKVKMTNREIRKMDSKNRIKPEILILLASFFFSFF